MFYKAILNSKQEIQIDSEQELQNILQEISAGKKLIIAKHAIINPSYLQAIIPDWERENDKEKTIRMYAVEGRKRNFKTPDSEFAFLLTQKMKMLIS